MPHVHSPDGVYLASTLETHSKNKILREAFFQPETRDRVDAALKRIWQELEELATTQKFGLNNLLLSLEVDVFSGPALCPRLHFFTGLAETINQTLKHPAIINPFCIQEYALANEELQKQFLDEAVTTLWEQKVLPELKKPAGDPLQNNPDSPDAIRSCLTRPDLAPHLCKMTVLEVTRLPLMTLPPEIGAFQNLQRLSLSDLPLAHFSPDLSGLTQLHEICLRNSPLTVFSADLSLCPEFKMLYINNTRLKYFSIRLPSDSKLEHIDLSSNELDHFGTDLSSNYHLKFLSLANNRLSAFTTSLAFCINLRHLNLSNNHLGDFAPDLSGCNNLTVLKLSENPNLKIHITPGTDAELLLKNLLA